MKLGATISGAIHGGLIAFAFFGIEWFRAADETPLTVTEIEFVDGSEFEAALSTAPVVPSEGPSELRPPAEGAAPGNVETPDDAAESAEVQALADVQPPEPEPARPEISFRNPVNVPTEAPAPSIAEIPSPDPLDRESAEPESPPATEPVAPLASIAAPVPGAKPTPPPEPEPEPETPDEVAETTAPDPDAAATPDPEPVEETSPDSVAEVQLEAPEGPAPQQARLPVAKPADLAAAARAAPAAELAVAEETPREPDTRAEATAAAATPENSTASAGGSTARRGPPLTSREKNALRLGIKKYYVYTGDRSDPAIRVTLRIDLDSAGQIKGKPTFITGSGGTPAARRALGQAGSRALIRAARAGEFRRLPAAKYDRWRRLNFVFTLDRLAEVSS